ncbi:MAG: SDR family oxidoreductase [Verrucomicrobiae bacterium]|nr:SDR family oxidoreductase [Verrucomicrobiae bacterium]MDW7979990.1 SDR family NAD(P)-dependent oxidoreductase [Verrucomicrobiales bacterium]
MQHGQLTGKIALVTGASRGLGKAIATALARAGASLVLTSRNAELLAATAAEIRAFGAEAEPFPADVSDATQVSALEQHVRSQFGKLHILVNNAGINIRKHLAELTLEDWNKVLATNLTSVFLMCRAFVPLIKGQGYGRIVNVASMLAHVGLPGRTAYSASKSGLLGFTRALALELAHEQITVNAICPGPYPTEINRAILESREQAEFFLSRVPLGRWGNPHEIGQLVVYLCSDAAGYITGTNILIDGGWTAQ